MAVTVTTEPTLRVSRPEVLFEGRHTRDVPGALNYDVSSDDQRFVMISPPQDSDSEPGPPVTSLILVENWFEELKRVVPTPRLAEARFISECNTLHS